jgi:hypothetical protein
MRITFTHSLLLTSFLCLGSCTASKQTSRSGAAGSYCEPTVPYTYATQYLPQADVALVLGGDTGLANRFSKHNLLIANAVGVLPLLREVIHLQGQAGTDTRVAQAVLYRKIHSRLLLASTEILSLVAELDCEGERAEQLANYLDGRDERRIRNLTLLSIVAGAVTTVVTAFLTDENAEKVVGIGGGLVSAGVGGAAAFSSNRSVPFVHTRNLLTDIWSQSEQSSVYSPFIWYVLNEKQFSNSGQTSIRHNIRQRWREYVLQEATDQQQQLYFGPGGDYQSGDLHARSDMLNQLQASVRSINQDLQSLLSNLPE